VPYQCLIEPTSIVMCESPERRFETLKTMLPSSLETLVIDAPKLEVYWWLWPILGYNGEFKEHFLHLRTIELRCSNHHNDSYEDFNFLADNAYAYQSRNYHGIQVNVTYRPDEFDPDWDNYDLEAVQLAEWSRSFGDWPSTSQYPPRLSIPTVF
jgi:hypothetical protein